MQLVLGAIALNKPRQNHFRLVQTTGPQRSYSAFFVQNRLVTDQLLIARQYIRFELFQELLLECHKLIAHICNFILIDTQRVITALLLLEQSGVILCLESTQFSLLLPRAVLQALQPYSVVIQKTVYGTLKLLIKLSAAVHRTDDIQST